jgi:hypothetical protein
MKETGSSSGEKPFFFEAGWVEEDMCEEIVKVGWEAGVARKG